MDSRELKARENCFGRVISDIVKRRSFRVSIVILKRSRPVRTPGITVRSQDRVEMLCQSFA
jgi:hypothetical protein